MKIELELNILPFSVPEGVAISREGRDSVAGEGMIIPLYELKLTDIRKLCADFVRGVYEEAGYPCPRTPGVEPGSVVNAQVTVPQPGSISLTFVLIYKFIGLKNRDVYTGVTKKGEIYNVSFGEAAYVDSLRSLIDLDQGVEDGKWERWVYLPDNHETVTVNGREYS